ncbi:helix-turn-helix domain-containing protein [Pinibacter aurantiacus]|uniref:Helix-turn-helix domain-containing protein n=1 Tax=Pinibacter aurantiacus TaxID=2851599 RepID=A0A9E2W9L8_9BACT|nr:helix-turn-helix transcriptional regulator [Pinibacter aurantiacus]MBV4360256.1 helix-turn-helix domain-containing protein [Pinibacter aurantiacus]
MAQHNSMHKIHEGRNIKRFREMRGWKQEGLAGELGEELTQRKISLLEQKETVDPEILQLVSDALKVPVDVLLNFDEEQAVNIISNSFDHGAFLNAGANPVFNVNPVEKWLEALEEIKRLNEALLKEKDSKIELLEKVIGQLGK